MYHWHILTVFVCMLVLMCVLVHLHACIVLVCIVYIDLYCTLCYVLI